MSETAAPAVPHMAQLRQHLLDTLSDLRRRDEPMEPDRARAIAQVAGQLIDSAKVEVDYLKQTGQDKSTFLETPPDAAFAHLGNSAAPPALEASGYKAGVVSSPWPGVTQHRMRG